ncbi:MAG: MFS transporter, partial [Alphaproteobacteria bacterium]
MAGLDRITGGIGRALTERSFRRFTLGNGIALIGYTMQRVAVAWLAWELTGSKSALGLLAFAELAPILFLAPLTGAIADRINPFTQFRIAQFLVLVHGVGLSILGFTGTISIEWLVAFQAFIGFVTSFSAPARMSLVSALVTTPNLSAAIALNALVFNISLVAGPLLMKPLLAVGGAHWAFVVHAFGFAVFNLMLIGVHPKAPERTAGARRGILRDVAAGMAYAARHATIGPLVALLVVT